MTTISTEAKFHPEATDESTESLGTAVADLVGNVIDNALHLADEVTRDAGRVANSAREFVRTLVRE